MSDESMGDEVYQPGTGAERDDAEMVNPEDQANDRDVDYMEEGYSPPERPLGADHHGVTAAEQRTGESLDERLRGEIPDVADPAAAGASGDGIGDVEGDEGEPVDREAGRARAGRLVAPEQGVPVRPEDVDDTVASDVGIDAGAASAEEAAVHVTDDPDIDRM